MQQSHFELNWNLEKNLSTKHFQFHLSSAAVILKLNQGHQDVYMKEWN